MIDISACFPNYARAVMAALDVAGHRGYLVGGSLRDILRGVTPHDYDMTTDATPEEMLEIFRDFRVIPTGLKHGTLTVLSDGHPIEVTTHRVDGEYLDSRRPESVSFTRQLSEDLSRRDFTVNAMAWHPETGLIDLFGGREDLEKGIIRAVGEPQKRFSEDALRILRAFRFAAQLNFEIEPRTLSGAAACREGLAHISAERIFSEVSRMLEAPAAVRGFRAMLDTGCEARAFYHTVLQAQLAGIAATKAGVTGAEVDAAARKVIEAAGYGPYFGHGYGHGIGLQVHEWPSCNASGETVMTENMVASAEPGIYLPGKFGVRIEDLVVFKADGCENLTESPKDLIII